jgi:hypothetical protein
MAAVAAAFAIRKQPVEWTSSSSRGSPEVPDIALHHESKAADQS